MAHANNPSADNYNNSTGAKEQPPVGALVDDFLFGVGLKQYNQILTDEDMCINVNNNRIGASTNSDSHNTDNTNTTEISDNLAEEEISECMENMHITDSMDGFN